MKIFAKNKKAYADYEVLQEFEAGVKLQGSEVKSCRNSNVNLKGSYISIKDGKAFAKEIHISPYKFSQDKTYEPRRIREILLNRKELDKIDRFLNERGTTIIPLSMYFKKSLVKMKIGICRGKKKHDRRQDLKRRDQNIEISRALKRFQ